MQGEGVAPLQVVDDEERDVITDRLAETSDSGTDEKRARRHGVRLRRHGRDRDRGRSGVECGSQVAPGRQGGRGDAPARRPRHRDASFRSQTGRLLREARLARPRLARQDQDVPPRLPEAPRRASAAREDAARDRRARVLRPTWPLLRTERTSHDAAEQGSPPTSRTPPHGRSGPARASSRGAGRLASATVSDEAERVAVAGPGRSSPAVQDRPWQTNRRPR